MPDISPDADSRNPTWLLDPPEHAFPSPPLTTNHQLLPLALLDWKDFERLCLRLARIEGTPEHWQLYGTEGQAQAGIDLYVRSGDGTYEVWQSKRYQSVTAGRIKSWVTKFLKEEWAAKAKRFILCTTASLEDAKLADAIEDAATRLRAAGLGFVPLGASEVSERLKGRPELVDDFFGRPWVEAFCGKDAAAGLGNRLSRANFSEFRSRLRLVYQSHFDAVDPGILSADGSIDGPRRCRGLAERFIMPDLVATDHRSPVSELPEPDEDSSPADREWQDDGIHVIRRTASPRAANPRRDVRLPIEQALAFEDRAIILGAPGAGKSSLLRYVALDLLSPAATLPALKRKWPDHVPLILSFPFWTRQIAKNIVGEDVSIPAIIAAWLKQQGEIDLAKLVHHLFDRRKTILLVDGIDEWADETSAATALTVLQTFAATHDVPVVVTSRPHGAKLLGVMDASWKRLRLAPFSKHQQTDYAASWYAFLDEGRDSPAGNARARAKAVIDSLQANRELSTLAGIPLLLSGLIALAREGARLPRSRYEAYGELVHRMLRLQPEARARAALAGGRGQLVDDFLRDQAFAALAFEMQAAAANGGRLDAIERKQAILCCAAFLREQIALGQEKSNEQARELLGFGASSIGVLVEKSPTEIGFFHRAFQELLAARHIGTMKLADQLALVRQHATDPRWHDVLLFVVQGTQRASEVEELVAAAEKAAGGDHDTLLLPLLAEIGFGKLNRTIALTDRLAGKLLGYIETGPDIDLRARILEIAVAGLQHEQTARLLRERFPGWFPQFARYEAETLKTIAKWSEPQVDDILWRNLEAEDSDMRRTAADLIAERHAGDEAWRIRLEGLLKDPSDVSVAAAALRALGRGWSELPSTRALVDQAAEHSAISVRVAAIAARLTWQGQTAEDLDYLLGDLEDSDWRLDREISAVLGQGWPGDPTLRAHVEKLFETQFRGTESAMRIIAAGFPGDARFARLLTKQLTNQKLHSFHDGWDQLAQAFSGNSDLVDEVLRASEREEVVGYELFRLAEISPTLLLQQRFLAAIDDAGSLRTWAVEGLIKYWPGQPEILAALRCVKDWPDDERSRVAKWFVLIFGRDEGVAMLRELAEKAGRETHIDMRGVVGGLLHAGELDSPEAVDQILAKIRELHPEVYYADGSYAALMELGPGTPAVVELAQSLLRSRTHCLGAIAKRLGDDESIRRGVLEIMAPLPLRLRSILADGLAAHAVESPWALDFLEQGRFDLEVGLGGHCLVEATRGRRLSGTIDDRFKAVLAGELEALGSGHHTRRLAALIGLGLIDEFEVARIWLEKDPLSFRFTEWELVGWSGLNDQLAECFSMVGVRLNEDGEDANFILSRDQLIERLGPRVDSYPGLHAIVDACARHVEKSDKNNVGALEYLARDSANRERVLDGCLRLFADAGSWMEMRETLAAADLIARHFGGDGATEERLLASYQDKKFAGPIAALCDGWPRSTALAKIVEPFKTAPMPREITRNPAIYLKLFAVRADTEAVVEQLIALAPKMFGQVWDGIPYWSGTMARRIREDNALQAAMMDELRKADDPNIKVTLASFLWAGAGLTSDLVEWCRSELADQQAKPIAQTGMDLWQGRQVLIARRLSQILAPQLAG